MQMMKDNYDINDPDNDDLIVAESMDNMYSIITKEETYDSLLDAKGRVLMLFNPLDGTPAIDNLIDQLIEYYSSPDVEMYERCAILVDIKKSDNVSKRYLKSALEPDLDFNLDWTNNDR